MGRIKDLLLTLFATGTGLVFLVLTLLSLPFNMLVVMRWWALEWWPALIAVLLMACVPGFGQLAYMVFTVIGAFFFYQAGFDWHNATAPTTKTFVVSELTPVEFAEYTHIVLGPKLRDYCVDNLKQKFGFQGKVPQSVPTYCDCFVRVMFEQVTQKEWVETAGFEKAPPAIQERFTKAVENQCLQPNSK